MADSDSLLEGIGRGKISRIVMGRLKIGVDLLAGIEELCKREKVKTGVILSGIGALERSNFRNAKFMPADYKMNDSYRLYLDVHKPLELVSLSGWIATTKEGQVNIHAHYMTSTIVDEKIASLGGHLTKGTITSIKINVVIGVIEDTNIYSAMDPRLDQVDVFFDK